MMRFSFARFYPGHRSSARIFRFLQRTRAAVRLASVRPAPADAIPLAPLLPPHLQPAHMVVRFGSPGPAQKHTLQLFDDHLNTLAFIKLADTPAARRLVHHEYDVLTHLPPHIQPLAPTALDLIRLPHAPHVCLLTLSPLPGPGLPLSSTLPPALHDLTDQLILHDSPCDIHHHPLAAFLLEHPCPHNEHWLDQLTDREWPIAFQHSDLAPWNVIRSPDLSSLSSTPLRAIDWEYARPQSLPALDLAYFLMQTSMLIPRRSPHAASKHAIRQLSRFPSPHYDPHHLPTLIRIAMRLTFLQSLADGKPADDPVNIWRKDVWDHPLSR